MPLAALAAMMFLTSIGCGKKHIIDIDHRFSMNVAKVPGWFPDKKMKLTAAEAEVIARYGRPDYMHIWWRPDGSLITSHDLTGKRDQMSELMKTNQRSWIYMIEGKEILFVKDRQSYREQPISSILKLVCTYGDPSHRTTPIMRDGRSVETWQWIEYGLQVELVDGEEVSKKVSFPATGSGTWASK